MRFGADKLRTFVFTNKLPQVSPPIILNSDSIKQVDTHKHLGIILSTILNRDLSKNSHWAETWKVKFGADLSSALLSLLINNPKFLLQEFLILTQ